MIIVAAYDITDDGRRSRVAAMLQTCGDRVQKSVFVIDVSAQDLAELRVRLMDTLDPREDSVYLFSQCGTCWPVLDCLGQASKPERVLFWAVF